ncbi:serine/threonine-protein kinase PINK1, mitochondrial [Siphateles boraxobius]|uniref:serine/threonine-protein kinase PINK1, mitochondrial n=1 Tax=Siphateles boraxobius TaxID=180520 RepID=UPI004062A3E2
MSVKHALGRGLELARSVFQLGLFKPAGRVAAKFRGERLRVSRPTRTVQPQIFLPGRYRFFRRSLSGLAAQLQSGAFRRVVGGGSPRNRAVFLAFGVGLTLIEQQLEEDRTSVAVCQKIQDVFTNKNFQSPLKPFTSGYKLEDYVTGKQIGKGCCAAVYEAAAPFAAPAEREKCSLVDLNQKQTGNKKAGPFPATTSFPLAMKMMWNIGASSSSDAILRSMSMELVPACPRALSKEQEEIALDGHFGTVPKRLTAHPNVITVYRAFTGDVPLLPGAQEEYPAALPARLNPLGLGRNRTLFLVMKNYPYTLRQYLKVCVPDQMQASLMLLQLLEGVDHLCRQGVAHRDLKSDNVLLECDSTGCPRLVITDFGCCLAEDLGLKLPFNSWWINRGGNSCLMAPEVATAVPGRGVTIDYSKADVWAVGAIGYELFGQPNPFYSSQGLDSRSYQERQLPPLPAAVPTDVQLVVKLLLHRNTRKRPSARVAANMLHISLWGKRVLARLDRARMDKMIDWLLCQSAVVLLKSRGPSGSSVETELQRSFLANIDLEDVRTAVSFLMYGQEQWQSLLMHYPEL